MTQQAVTPEPVDEQRLIEELHALIRYIYSEKLAVEMIDTFGSVLDTKKTVDGRLAVIRHWIDLYKLEKYRRERRRRRPTFNERIKPCAACGYPASHRHHLWDLATHGENEVTVQLCANCHELLHIIYNALAKESDYSRKLLAHIMQSGRVPYNAVERLLEWCLAMLRYEANNGWVEPYKTSARWVEQQLGWRAYQQKAREFTENTETA